ncbi:MAG: hypothetical protein KatS3mg079_611 [Caloramator sp.]|uniref:ATP synthase I chain n=1 Tax=Caloramator proteoclasticus DSM 10124 TaxID=1121262 RepID=A0A1M4SAU9_9CLOT|nr:ATP synthase subunit I [Caloramator sp. ALD01]GIW49135.1 MAG: hypothetical protein KatS3mg079_611 [Caloramator sp.]SHE29309.1 ATP synthase I chain [Caloramator proteoclasticus DSM 10124]
MVDYFIFSFILKRLKFSLNIFLLLMLSILVFNANYALSYFLGYIIGIFNFILLSLGTNYIITRKVNHSKIIQFIFFTMRIILIALILASAVKDGYNVFILFLGFLTINISIKIGALLDCRREGQYGKE